MGKNQNNNFVPPKGRPSGSGREGSGLKDAFAVTGLQEDNKLAENYTEGEDEPSSNVHVRHPNRNVDKINTTRQAEDECLVNKAIANTLKNGGDVYILEPNRMPNMATMAATLRF